MKTIYKYRLQVPQIPLTTTLEIPLCGRQFKFLFDQGMGLFMYCVVDKEAPLKRVEVALCWTGNPIPDPTDGWSFTFRDGGLIWHVFVRVSE